MPDEMETRRERLAELYEAALRPRRPAWRRLLAGAWTCAGLSGLALLCWAEPWSARWLAALRAGGTPGWLVDWTALPLVMAARAALLIETLGYAYHRFFQHLGWLTRRGALFRSSQRYHWMHHMILYPVGRFYKRDAPYASSEKGFSWSWTLPALLVAALALATMGARLQALFFVLALGAYAKLVIDTTHSRFHESRHPWTGSRYFRWLEAIHLLHHWDHRANFTIVHPLMDALFGTYLAPARHPRELETALKDRELTASDLINWRYLLLEATPAEYAAFISQARRHPRSLRKLAGVLEALRLRLELRPEDAEARELLRRALELGPLIAPPGSAVPA